MRLVTLLEKNRARIIDDWFQIIIGTYPPEARKLFTNLNDSFNNPVGSTAVQSMKEVFDLLLKEASSPDEIQKAFDPLVRIRAVQEFSPCQALQFVLELKRVVRVALEKELKEEGRGLDREVLAFESRIDTLLLIGFDIYMGCREQIFAFKANHVKERTLNLLKRANVLCEVPEVGTEIIPHNVYKNGGFDKTKTSNKGD